MRKIGLLGGMAWPSTVHYYRTLCERVGAEARAAGHGLPLPAPEIVIDSVNIAATRAMRGVEGDETSWAAYDAMLLGVMQRLEGAGAEVLAMASNTPHARLHAIRDRLSRPVVSILEATADAVAATGAGRALVLGTSVTMRADGYRDALASRGIDPGERLPEDEIEGMQALIDAEFEAGATERGRALLLDLCSVRGNGRCVVLACTELPLAWPGMVDRSSFQADGFAFVNSTAAHVEAILAAARTP